MVLNRSIIGGSLLRATGTSYQVRDDGTVSNLYTLQLINKSGKDIKFDLKPADENLKIQLVNQITEMDKDGSAKLSFFVVGDPKGFKKYKNNIKIFVVSDGEVVETLKTTFISPSSN